MPEPLPLPDTLPADMAGVVAACGALPLPRLVEALREDQARRWRAGRRLSAEAYLDAFPAVAGSAEDALVLIWGEVLLRLELGEAPQPAEYRARFPHHADALDALFDLQRQMEPSDAPTTVVASEPPGATLGAWPAVPGYEIVGELGRGGMGVVYKARQASLNRIVALKMLLAGPYASPEAHARFRGEAEAVARLRHPNIVQIHEIGERDGRPYLVLEYVEGGSLDGKLNGTPQNPRAAAAMAETLARAVHAAHQQGVVHRDLKPANVLLLFSRDPPGSASDALPSGSRLNEGEPKITDFGLAKQLDADVGRTPSEAILGTPSYMAPEQASGKMRSVGPAADVYALGAILYEMLTGRPPFRGETPLDTLQQVVVDEPVPPRVLQPKVPTDLETICLKCLHKEPAKRYASAAALADDVRRFLAGEPIRARPVGPAGRLGRWCRRKPTLAGVTGALVLVAVGAVAGLTALWLRAEHHRQVAEIRQRESEDDLRLARQAIDNYATKVSENLRIRQEDLRPLRKELLETVVPLYETLIARHADKPEVQAECGDAYVRLAFIARDIEDPARACRLFEQAAGVFAALADRHPDDSTYRQKLADVRIDLGELYRSTDRAGEAEASLQESLKGWRRLAESHPGEPQYEFGEAHARVALAQLRATTQRRPADARAEYQRALEVADRLERGSAPIRLEYRRVFANARGELGQLCLHSGELPLAEAQLRRAVAAQAELLRSWPYAADYKQDLARSRMTLGKIHWKAGKAAAAEEEFQNSLVLSEELVRDNPSAAYFPEYLADSRQALARFYTAAGQPSRAVPELKKVLGTLESLPPVYRDLTANQQRLAGAHTDLAAALAAVGSYKEAAAESGAALKVVAALSNRHPEEDSYRGDLMSSHMALGSAYLALQRLDDAGAEYDEALKIGMRLLQRHPGDARYQLYLLQSYADLARCHYAGGKKRECEEALRAAVKVGDGLDGNDGDVLMSLAKAHNNLAVLCAATERLAEAGEEYLRALEMTRRLIEADPHTIEHHVMRGTYYVNLAILQRNTGKPEASLDTFAGAIGALGAVLRGEGQHARARKMLGMAHWNRALALNRLGRAAEALADWEKALALDDGEGRGSILANRAESLARAGDHSRALTEAEALVAAKDVDPALVYWMAWVCTYAKTAAEKDGKLPPDERARLAERYASRGVALLRQAHTAGHFKDPNVLREFQTAPDLDPLRKRPEFQKLLAEVEKKAAMP
jgi:tetratricopeptide (TPR) repeat protein